MLAWSSDSGLYSVLPHLLFPRFLFNNFTKSRISCHGQAMHASLDLLSPLPTPLHSPFSANIRFSLKRNERILIIISGMITCRSTSSFGKARFVERVITCSKKVFSHLNLPVLTSESQLVHAGGMKKGACVAGNACFKKINWLMFGISL